MPDRRPKPSTDLSPREAPRTEESLSSEALAAAVGITAATLARLVRLGVVEPVAPGSTEFAAADAVRLRWMVRLRGDLGVSFVGAAIIVGLLQRLRRLAAEG